MLARSDNHKLLTTAATAVCTWQTVSSGFFPPQVLVDLGQEKMAHGAEDQMAFQTQVQAALIMIQAQFPFLILKTTLDAPARKGHLEHRGHRGLRRCVADEILDFG